VPDSGGSAPVCAVLFDVDFTLAKPGPDLGPVGYRRLAERFGLAIDPARYDEARVAAIRDLRRHPELDHDEEIWVEFTVRIIEGMGGAGESARPCAVEMVHAWEHSHNFELYEDVLPVLRELRRHGLKIGLVSNTARDLEHFVGHHGLDVDAVVSSGRFGKTKPHPSIFEWVLGRLEVPPALAAMVGDSVDDDVEGARALGMQAFLLDRDARHADRDGRLTDLRQLPAALGLQLRSYPGDPGRR
jgi:HAD superfamily hydrolase (TIGR01662 family)